MVLHPLEQEDAKDDQSINLSKVASAPSPSSVKWATEEQDKTASSLSGTTAGRKRHHRHKKSSSSVSNGDRIKSKRTVGDYNLTTTLGSGGMGKVKLGIHQQQPQKKLAVKIIQRKHDDEYRQERTLREANILYLLHHPYIVNLEAPIIVDTNYYYLMMEYVSGGQLLDYIISHGKLREKDARRFARQIISALDYCHRNSIVHRDLKIENILVSRTGHVKIIDFGLSNLFSPWSQMSTFCGSLYFAAPELLHAKSYTGPEVDVWSFGVVLYVLVCGKVPFDDQNTQTLHDKIKRGAIEYPAHLTLECKNLLGKVLVVNPNNRATVSDILVHSWMVRGYDGPVDNHIPQRSPLSLPLDTEVIRRMTVFDFGTEEEINSKLEEIITSEEFQKAIQLRSQRSSLSHSRNGSTSSTSSSTGGGFFSFVNGGNNSPTSQTFTAAQDDPQSIPNAYHPLVSIYYLVKEKMERERATGAEPSTPMQIPPMDLLNKRRGSLPLPDPIKTSTGQQQQQPVAPATTLRHRPQHKRGHKKSFSLATATAALTLTSKPPHPVEQQPQPSPVTTRRAGRGHQKAKSHAGLDFALTDNNKEEMDNDITTADTTARQSHHGHARKLSSIFMRSTNSSKTQQHSSSDDDNNTSQDVIGGGGLLKGLFSMRTTSTKPVGVIRNDLIQVLDNLHVMWIETEAARLFECSEEDGVQFEINIVKVPWLLGVHGLQFRRVSGNSWQYKNLCSRILMDLKL